MKPLFMTAHSSPLLAMGVALAAVAGLRGTGDWATDERPKNFREYILWRNPNGTAPLFALTAKMKKETVDDPEFSWWDEPNDLVRLQVNGAVGNTAVETTIVVDSADPSTSSPTLAWGLATHLKPGDLLMVEPSSDNATFNHEVIKVTNVISTTTFQVQRAAAGTTIGNIANDAWLVKIGSAYAEGTGAPDSTSRNPMKYSNYTQIFKDTYELTKTAAATKVRTGDPLANEKKRKGFDHARDIEMALLFGRKSETTGPNGKPLRTFGGIRSFIGSATTTVLTNGYTLNTVLDAVTPVFDFDTEAGDTRIVFAGNIALNRFNTLIQGQTSAARVNFQGLSKVYGMNFNEYVIPQGRLLIKTHPLLNRHSLYRNSIFIVDPSAIKYRPLKGRDTKFEDNIQTKGEDVIRGQWLTEFGIEVRYGGLTCGYIGAWNV